MRYTHLFIPTKRNVAPQLAANAHLLEKAGFVIPVAAGVYNLLPLGLRVLQKIEQIVREEMNTLGASEVSFSALQSKTTWEQSGRWQDPNFRSVLYYDPEADMTLAATHEEPMTQVVKASVQSYRDLPVLLYQFQTKFRKELRAKSGLLRGREFRMKDLYSFHTDEKTHQDFYEQAASAYLKVFGRLGLEAYRVKASGGIFSKEHSDEFQVICPTGEDEVLVDRQAKTGFNREVESELTEEQKNSLERVAAIEVGNIFHLGSKYAEAFDLQYLDQAGERRLPVMGSYGIGISRLLGTLAELNHDEHGLIWSSAVAPFQVYLADLTPDNQAEALYTELTGAGYEVLWDDRPGRAGEKLVDADLIGLPLRVVVSAKTEAVGQVEVKDRRSGQTQMLAKADLVPFLKKQFS